MHKNWMPSILMAWNEERWLEEPKKSPVRFSPRCQCFMILESKSEKKVIFQIPCPYS